MTSLDAAAVADLAGRWRPPEASGDARWHCPDCGRRCTSLAALQAHQIADPCTPREDAA